jgi:hypothetical protein
MKGEEGQALNTQHVPPPHRGAYPLLLIVGYLIF